MMCIEINFKASFTCQHPTEHTLLWELWQCLHDCSNGKRTRRQQAMALFEECITCLFACRHQERLQIKMHGKEKILIFPGGETSLFRENELRGKKGTLKIISIFILAGWEIVCTLPLCCLCLICQSSQSSSWKVCTSINFMSDTCYQGRS